MPQNNHQEKLAKILRVDKNLIMELEANLERVTGKIGVLESIAGENDVRIHDRMATLGLVKGALASEVFDALISKIEADDLKICTAADVCSARGVRAATAVCELVTKVRAPHEGYFLKFEKARELLRAEPPKKILEALGYSSVEEMLSKEDLLEVYSALRFLEDQEWQNKVFFKQYETLTPADFEVRKLEVRALGEKWAAAAEKFVAKKYHNVSHLKELGVIFVIPVFLGISGESLRLLSLLFHYMHEIAYYSDLFKRFAGEGAADFASRIISLLRGDVIERRAEMISLEPSRSRWLVVQRYLAKGDENDMRLFLPHINPEALHWQRAEEDILNLERVIPNFKDGLDFWKGLGWVGDFFQTDTGVPVLVSFNLVDTVMALVKERELIKYLYHQEEAMWNKIFMSYFGPDSVLEYSQDYIIKGYFDV